MLPNQSTQSPEPTSPARRRRRLDGRLIGLTDQNRQPGKSTVRKNSKFGQSFQGDGQRAYASPSCHPDISGMPDSIRTRPSKANPGGIGRVEAGIALSGSSSQFTSQFETSMRIGMSASQTDKSRAYEAILREAGVRITRPRKVILSIVGGHADHPDALEIYRRAVAIDPAISLSTVYRTMKLLEEKGAIHRHAFEGGPSRFEHAAAEHLSLIHI